MRTCAGCDKQVAPNVRGRPRKWCSERCRRNSTYVRHCLDCGARLNSSDGNGPRASIRCVPCAARAAGAERKVWDREAIVEAMREWERQHGQPPRVVDWDGAEGAIPRQPGVWPSYNAVFREFTSWRAAMAEAGFTPRKQGPPVEGGRMSLTVCPICGYEYLDPEPEWVDEREVCEVVCEGCEVDWYADDAGLP